MRLLCFLWLILFVLDVAAQTRLDQSVLGTGYDGHSIAMSLNAMVTGPKPADYGEVLMVLYTYGRGAERVIEDMNSATERVDNLLNTQAGTKDAVLKSWHKDKEWYCYNCSTLQNNYSRRQWMQEACPYNYNPGESNSVAVLQYYIVVQRPQLTTRLARNLTSTARVSFDEAVWQLNEDTEALLRDELQTQGLKELHDKAKVYGAASGMTAQKLVEVVERINDFIYGLPHGPFESRLGLDFLARLYWNHKTSRGGSW